MWRCLANERCVVGLWILLDPKIYSVGKCFRIVALCSASIATELTWLRRRTSDCISGRLSSDSRNPRMTYTVQLDNQLALHCRERCFKGTEDEELPSIRSMKDSIRLRKSQRQTKHCAVHSLWDSGDVCARVEFYLYTNTVDKDTPCPGDIRADNTYKWLLLDGIHGSFCTCSCQSTDSSKMPSIWASVASDVFCWATLAQMWISSTPAAFERRGRGAVSLLLCSMFPTIFIVAVTRLFPFRKTGAGVHSIYSCWCVRTPNGCLLSPTTSLSRIICSSIGPSSQCSVREWSDVMKASILSPGCCDH